MGTAKHLAQASCTDFQNFLQFCHPFKFYIAKTRIIDDDDAKETTESPEKDEGDVDKKVVKKKSKQTSESPKKEDAKNPLNVTKSQDN